MTQSGAAASIRGAKPIGLAASVRRWRRWRQRALDARERWDVYRQDWAVQDEIEAIARRGRPVVVGPWLSEVGFETLYWLPFLRWIQVAFRLEPDRLVAVSRGGVASWYQDVAAQYIEIWDEMSPADFSRENAARGAMKQIARSALDEWVLERVARRLGTRDFDVLHPSLMYRLFGLYWSGQRAMNFVDRHTRVRRVAAAELIDPALLPRDYVAVKFYGARSLPDRPDVAAAVRAIVARVAERHPVVLLDTGLVLGDDHADYALETSHAVVSARQWMTPRTNLGVQTQIIAGATGFIGTCGSLAWLAPALGVNTSALYVDASWLHAHLAVALRAYHKLDAGRFAAADLRACVPDLS